MKRVIIITAIIVLVALSVCLVCLALFRNNSDKPTESSSSHDEEVTEAVASTTAATKPCEPATEHVLNQDDAAAVKVEMLKSKPLNSRSKLLDIEEIYQNPELPTGCESVALTAALRYLGYDLEKTEIADNYLIYDDDMFWGYVGDPYSDDGAGIYPPGLTNTANAYLADQKSKYTAVNTMGYSLDELYRLIDNGCPVLVWTTMAFYPPNIIETGYFFGDTEYFWYDNEHCMVLIGYDLDENTVICCDPLDGIVTCDADEFEAIHDEIGRLSMTIVNRGANEQV